MYNIKNIPSKGSQLERNAKNKCPIHQMLVRKTFLNNQTLLKLKNSTKAINN